MTKRRLQAQWRNRRPIECDKKRHGRSVLVLRKEIDIQEEEEVFAAKNIRALSKLLSPSASKLKRAAN